VKISLLVILGIFFLGVFFTQGADAKEFYPSISYRLEESPTVCTTGIVGSDLKISSEEWLLFVEEAVNYWEFELKNSSEYPQVWQMNFKKINNFNDPKTNHSGCTIIIHYEKESIWFGTLGVFYIDDWVNEAFLEWDPIGPSEKGKILIFDESFICTSVCQDWNPKKPIYETVVHEIGHALGLGHFTYADKEKNQRVENGRQKFPSIMYPFASEFQPDAIITSKDTAKLKQLYGTLGFYAFSENPPPGILPPDVEIIPGIPVPEHEFFIDTSISESKIHEAKNQYETKILDVSGQLDDYYMKPGHRVVLQMIHPDGNIEAFTVSPKNSGEFQLTFQIDHTYPIGIYTVDPSYYGFYSEEFQLTFEIVPLDEEITKEEIVQEEIEEILQFNYEIFLPKKVELSENLSRTVTGYLIPHDDVPADSSLPEIYLFLRNYYTSPYTGYHDLLISSTTANDDLTFTFDVSPESITAFNDLGSMISFSSMKVFVGVDKAVRNQSDSDPQIVFWSTAKETAIPNWIKNNAGWWAEGQIDDNSFVQAIEFMIKQGIILIPSLPESSSETTESVPAWVKNNAGWWAEGQIDDNSFVQGIEYLVKVGIIQVT